MGTENNPYSGKYAMRKTKEVTSIIPYEGEDAAGPKTHEPTQAETGQTERAQD